MVPAAALTAEGERDGGGAADGSDVGSMANRAAAGSSAKYIRAYYACTTKRARRLSHAQVFTRRCAPPVVVWPVVSLLELRTGAELTWTKLIRIRDEALALAAGNAAGVALVLGTDTLDEVAHRDNGAPLCSPHVLSILCCYWCPASIPFPRMAVLGGVCSSSIYHAPPRRPPSRCTCS